VYPLGGTLELLEPDCEPIPIWVILLGPRQPDQRSSDRLQRVKDLGDDRPVRRDRAGETGARPTLVLRCKGDRVALLEEGRDMARLIPGASFIELPGNNHALLALAGTPAFDQFLEEATTFVATQAC
jgi:pimeloyl-ACP methyl ester carboxylesterase